MNVRKAACLLLLLLVVTVPLATTSSNSTTGKLVINEIFWGGTSDEVEVEWIELVNTSKTALEVNGWRLVSSDGHPSVVLVGTVSALSPTDTAAGYYLLERGSDDAVPGIPADRIYIGALNDAGEALMLIDDTGTIVDTANLPSDRTTQTTWPAWPAGSNGWSSPSHASMERIDYRLEDAPDSWATSTAPYVVDGAFVFCGTPREENASLSIPPTASIAIAPARPMPEQPVLFDARASSGVNDTIVTYLWTFGDGETAGSQTASHAYRRAGEYVVTLGVEDEEGETTLSEVTVIVSEPLPPVADFSYHSPDQPGAPIKAGHAVLFSDETASAHFEISEHRWSFGDGEVSSVRNPTHTYALPGTYIACLTVVDEQGTAATQTESLVVASEPPVVRVTWCPIEPVPNEAVGFDATGSYDPDGTIATYSWDNTADGTVDAVTTEPRYTVSFPSAQTQSLTVFATDADGDSCVPVLCTVYVDQPPVAQFQLSSFAVTEAETIDCTDLSYDLDGAITAWNWSFGSEAVRTQSSPAYAFLTAGTHLICLEVTDDVGAVDATCAEVSVSNLSPIACLVVQETEKPTGERFVLDASGSSDPSPAGSLTLYEWDLDGDGTYDRETTSPTLTHAYADNGAYDVSVRVTDNAGASAVSGTVRLVAQNRIPNVTDIAWTPELPDDGSAVGFSASFADADGEVVCLSWSVDGHVVSQEREPILTFEDDGAYTVCLVVTDNDGAASTPYSVVVDVENACPVAAFSTALIDPETPHTIRLDASASHDPSPAGTLVHVAWDFDDGTTCPGSAQACGGEDPWCPIHTFPASGTYSVTLIVMDEQGGIGRSTRTIRVGS